MPVEPGMPGEPGIPDAPGNPSAPPGVAEDPGIPGKPGSDGRGGTCVPVTDTLTSKPSSPSSFAPLGSPDELEEVPFGGPFVGIDGEELPEEDAVPPGLELLEPDELDRELELEGIDGIP